MSTLTPPAGVSMDAETYRGAVADLLGVLAYAELTAFERLAADSGLAPTLVDKAALAGLATDEFAHFRRLWERLEAIGADPEEAMAPFIAPLEAWHACTASSNWLESLVTAYVGNGMATDFYREIAANVDEGTKALVEDVLADMGHAEFVVRRVREAIAADPVLAGRLALWARRLVGEALTQAQRVAVDRAALAQLLVGSGDLAEVTRMFARITDRHTERMESLGLSA